ncbi:MAG: outer membrane beta-barrel protein [Thermoguttaceae bacterium]|nr:outer membrane beta-barrel protein [Thermoguttaceae bacterium]
MKKLNLFAGIAVAISGLFASQTFAASGCTTAACDPAAAAAACDPAAAAADSAPNAPVPPAEADCAGALSATCASSPSCDPAAAAACNSGCNPSCLSAAPGCGAGCQAAAPGCGACSACGSFTCNGHCGGLCGGLCGRRGCADTFIGKMLQGTCWSGYMNAGYFTNFGGNRSNGYVDCWSETTPAFNAFYLSGVKKAYTGGCGYDFGWGMDFMFGEDARILRSVRGLDQGWTTGHMSDGRDSYGFAMPQLYMEMAINNWIFKAGHFYGLLGYEGATANSRFFYTKGLLCSVSPVATTGALATYTGFQNLDMTLGWVNGWGNGFDNSLYGEGMVEGAFTYHMNEYASIKYAFLAGTCDIAVPLGALGPIAPASAVGDASVHTVTLDLQLTGSLESVSLLYYGDFDGNTVLVLGEHLYKDLNCCTKAGFRFEWMNTINDTKLTTFGIGLNYHPCGNQNLFFRPEFRYDKSTNAALLNGKPDQFTIGFDLMLTF